MTTTTAGSRASRAARRSVVAMCTLLALTFLAVTVATTAPGLAAAAALEEPSAPAIRSLPPAWPQPPELDAAAFVLMESGSGQVLAASRAESRRPVASTIKILTALTALQRADITDEVVVGGEVEGVPGASAGLAPGATWTVGELATAVLARSGNDAAHALAVHVGGSVEGFLDLMRDDLADIGLDGITLTDVSGLDDGNLLSAADLAHLARVALDDDDLRRIVSVPIVTLPNVGAIESRNRLLELYPDATGLKTGYTQAAGNSLVASARRGERELIAVVLGSGDDPSRFEAAAALLDHGFDEYRTTQLAGSLGFAVAGGGAVRVTVEPFAVSVPSDERAQLLLPVQARPPDQAPAVPIAAGGQQLGEVSAELVHDRAAAAPGTSAIGRSVADGAYAALRAGAATGSLR